MNNLIKNPFERKQKGAASALCIICMFFFMASGCGSSKMSDIEETDEKEIIGTDSGVLFDNLVSAPKIIVPKETLPEWLVVKVIDNYAPWLPILCLGEAYRGEWKNQIVYFTPSVHSSCPTCELFNEDGKTVDNLPDCRTTSKNWIKIFGCEEIFEFYKN